MNKNLVPDMISIKEFVDLRRGNMTDQELNWELKSYINSIINKAEKAAKDEVNNAKNNGLILPSEWIQAHSIINSVWLEIKGIINDMWFNNELLEGNIQDIFLKRAYKMMLILNNIESDNIRNLLLN